MNTPVEFALAISNAYRSSMGAYEYKGSFNIVVQNLAYEKQVSIWTQTKYFGWQDIPAYYVQSLPGNLELWSAPASKSNTECKFVAKYTVRGTTYWDNNGGADYIFPYVSYENFSTLSGAKYKVVLGDAKLDSGMLHVYIAVQNLAYHKIVGILFTTNDWHTVQTVYGTYDRTMNSGLEVWHVNVPVGFASKVDFTIFYRVAGNEYWDNNFWRNYRVTSSAPQQWGNAL
jgi:hypothetical protein